MQTTIDIFVFNIVAFFDVVSLLFHLMVSHKGITTSASKARHLS